VAGIQDKHQDGRDDVLVPDPLFADELGISLRTLARWDGDPKIGLPPFVKLRNRKYRWRSKCDEFKKTRLAALMEAA